MRTKNGPPSRLHDVGKKAWYRMHDIQCDRCHHGAVYRFKGHNVCGFCLNQPYAKAKLADGTSYLEAVDTATCASKSIAGLCMEA